MATRKDTCLPTGAQHYSRAVLHIYDFLVHTFNNNFAWRCPTESVLLPFFHANAGPRHMDVGVGTGFFPHHRHAQGDEWPQKLTLVDINENCLEQASEHIGLSDRTTCIAASVLQDPLFLPDSEPKQFDSISLMYLLHCLPCSPEEKGRVFANLKPYLSTQGTLFGATLLGRGAQENWFGRLWMGLWNSLGVFNNSADGKEDFIQALEAEFDEVEGYVVGYTLIFRARKPKW